jgi:hypothetical protein
MLHRSCRKNLHSPGDTRLDHLQTVDIQQAGCVGTGLALVGPVPANPKPSGSDTLNNLANLREGQLVEEIALLYRKVSGGDNPGDARARCAQAYLRELLRFKQESLELLRYQRAGQGARWQRRPELH